MDRLKRLRLGVLLGLLVPLVIWAGDLVLPHRFSSGDPIRASDMNDNFDAVAAAVNSKADRPDAGARLRLVQLRSAEGVPLPYVGSPMQAGVGLPYYDAVLGVFCWPARLGSRVRCLPYGQAGGTFAALSGAVPIGNSWLDSTCSQRVVVVSEPVEALTPADLGLGPVAPAFVITQLAGGGFAFNRVTAPQGVAASLYVSSDVSALACFDDLDCPVAQGAFCNTAASSCRMLDGGTFYCGTKPAVPAGGWKYVSVGAIEPEASFAELSVSVAP
jgi:hypothetical protein